MQVKIINSSYLEKSKEKDSHIFHGFLKETKTGFIVDYVNENKEKGKFEFIFDNDEIYVKNVISGATANYHFANHLETAGTYLDSQYRSMNFKLRTNSLTVQGTNIKIDYDILAFNGIPGTVHFFFSIEENFSK